jgi:hypothetical protein
MKDRLCQFVVGCIEEKRRLLQHEGTRLFVELAGFAYQAVQPQQVIAGAGVLICAAIRQIETKPLPSIRPLEERADEILLGLLQKEGWSLTETALILEAGLTTIAANADRWQREATK